MTMYSLFMHPPILFFILGVFASICKSNLDTPEQIKQFISIYLLMAIGLKAGYELSEVGLATNIIYLFAFCILFSIVVTIIAYIILQFKENNADAALISACYGSVSIVTFLSAIGFLENNQIAFDGYITTALGLMEAPPILISLLLYNIASKKTNPNKNKSWVKSAVKSSLLEQSILMLLGSIIIGYLCGLDGKEELKPFVGDIFKGMLSIYLLGMGVKAGKEMPKLLSSSKNLIIFAIITPCITGTLGMLSSVYIFHLNAGNALLITMLFGSASYVAVPSSMQTSVPESNVGMAVTMTLLITFILNIIILMPIYYQIIVYLLHQ
ncbi:MAG: sodium-dependent bicarbonate transport family permease [Burkholderiales bacterium]|nr:sodium-dependent bicarbonate transport family permease [Burkholderiales bacterium]